MNIHTLVLGSLDTNCYIVEDGKNAIIIDPAADSKYIMDFVKDYNVVEILVTHHHFDHVGALSDLESYFHLKHNNFHSSIFDYEVIKTPGHTLDSIIFYFKNINSMFCGDFIFYNSIGRCDFPESDSLLMFNSLELMKSYSDNITIYPGHGRNTTLGYEKNNFDRYF